MADTIFFDLEELALWAGRVRAVLDERQRRLVFGGLAGAAGRGGLKLLGRISGLSQPTLIKGRAECRALSEGSKPSGPGPGRVRKPGGGRMSLAAKQPEIISALMQMMEGCADGPLLWTTKSTRTLSKLLAQLSLQASPTTVAKLLRGAGFNLQPAASGAGFAAVAQRDAQLRHISAMIQAFAAGQCPVLAVEVRTAAPDGTSSDAGMHTDAGCGPDAGVQIADVAAGAIGRWWRRTGRSRHPGAQRLMITADFAGGGICPSQQWQASLQRLADATGLEIHLAHLPPATFKWNRIGRLFSERITRQGQGVLEIVVSLAGGLPAPATDAACGAGCSVSVSTGKESLPGGWNPVIRPLRVQTSKRL